jgi:hypothetical protein
MGRERKPQIDLKMKSHTVLCCVESDARIHLPANELCILKSITYIVSVLADPLVRPKEEIQLTNIPFLAVESDEAFASLEIEADTNSVSRTEFPLRTKI